MKQKAKWAKRDREREREKTNWNSAFGEAQEKRDAVVCITYSLRHKHTHTSNGRTRQQLLLVVCFVVFFFVALHLYVCSFSQKYVFFPRAHNMIGLRIVRPYWNRSHDPYVKVPKSVVATWQILSVRRSNIYINTVYFSTAHTENVCWIAVNVCIVCTYMLRFVSPLCAGDGAFSLWFGRVKTTKEMLLNLLLLPLFFVFTL